MTKEVIGYLPDERPPIGKLLLYALQQVIVMFPATVTVALITGFQVSTTIFASGLATICFALITGRKLPLYYGSSFAYLSAVSGLLAAEGLRRLTAFFQQKEFRLHSLVSFFRLYINNRRFARALAGRNAVEKSCRPA